jgi:hypothetical protein
MVLTKMRLGKMPQTYGYKLVIVLTCIVHISFANAGELRGTEWKVTHGDTLYQIGRTIYPGNASKQSLLRQHIMILNTDIFGKNADMEVGVVLTLPQYVVDPQASAPVKKQQPVPTVPLAKPAPVAAPPAATAGKQWIVKRGDTLYGISRSLYPGDARKQQRLRQDIVQLNPSVFASGANNLAVGVVLQLPDNGQPLSTQPKLAEPVRQPASDVVEPAPELAPEPARSAVVTDQESEKKRSAAPRIYRIESGFLASLGLAYGGDELVEIDNGFDIMGGSGINFRLGYQQLRDDGHGYRVALGYQYHSSEDVSLKSTYLQAAYQYRAKPVVYGIGVVAHSGAQLEDTDLDVDYDSAIGLLFYAENVGSGLLAGWGLSYTALDFDDKDSSDSVDASHVEVYYSWGF